MSRVRVKLEGVEKVRKALADAGRRGPQLLGRALFLEGEAIMARSKPLVPVFEGALRASGFVKLPVIRGRSVSVTLGYGGAASRYAVFIHEGVGPAVGRPAFNPPASAFVEWTRRVLGDESLAFVVARSVGQKGFKGSKFLERPLRERSRGMATRIAARMRRDLERG